MVGHLQSSIPNRPTATADVTPPTAVHTEAASHPTVIAAQALIDELRFPNQIQRNVPTTSGVVSGVPTTVGATAMDPAGEEEQSTSKRSDADTYRGDLPLTPKDIKALLSESDDDFG